ncbi:DNA repair protein xrcc3 [Rhizoclosmatium sp. JEL0117]|nr:DNA repair protein xrcc3 [Rhizoclosmatium sp. JEL0117]
MSNAINRTFLGMRVWPASMLKTYFPFLISGTTAYFLFNFAGVKMRDDPTDKWANIVDNVRQASKQQALKNDASDWWNEQFRTQLSQLGIEGSGVDAASAVVLLGPAEVGVRLKKANAGPTLTAAVITEVFGESAAGKTQLALQLAVTVHWPKCDGGLDGGGLVVSGAVLILSESLFASKRFVQLASALQPPSTSIDPIHITDNTHVIHVRDPDTLLHICKYTLPALMLKSNIKLVVIDSVAATLRYSFSNDEPTDSPDPPSSHPSSSTTCSSDTNNSKNSPGHADSSNQNAKRRKTAEGPSKKNAFSERVDRNSMIFELASALKKIASQFEAAVLCVNQVTAKISQNGSPADVYGSSTVSLVPIATGSDRGMEKAFIVDESRSKGTSSSNSRLGGLAGEDSNQPALGLLWSTCVNTRICLAKVPTYLSGVGGGSGDHSGNEDGSNGGNVGASIVQLVSKRRMSVVFSPNGPSGGPGVECVITSDRGLVGIQK